MKTKYLTEKELHAVNYHTYMVWVDMDQAEKHIIEVESICQDKDINRHTIRQKINQMKKTSETFRHKINEVHKNNPEMIEKFGEVSDEIDLIFKRQMYEALKKELNL